MSRIARPLLPVLLGALLGVTACGQDADPDRSTVDAHTVGIVHATGIGGPRVREPRYVGTPAALRRYTRGLLPDLAEQLVDLVHAHPAAPGRALVAAVAHVGCEVPTSVDVSAEGGRLSVSTPPDPPDTECYAAVWSIALLDVPAALAPGR